MGGERIYLAYQYWLCARRINHGGRQRFLHGHCRFISLCTKSIILGSSASAEMISGIT